MIGEETADLAGWLNTAERRCPTIEAVERSSSCGSPLNVTNICQDFEISPDLLLRLMYTSVSRHELVESDNSCLIGNRLIRGPRRRVEMAFVNEDPPARYNHL